MKENRIKLLVVQGRARGKHLLFARGDYYFGRGDECQVRPNSPMVSRQHCLLRITAEGVFLRDLASRNGTLVNGVLLDREKQLQPGDQIQIGPLVFELQLEALSKLPPASKLGETIPGNQTVPEITLPEVHDPADSTSETKEGCVPFRLPEK